MTHFDSLRSTFEGTLLQAGDAAYDGARQVHNGLIDRRPALIAQCRNAKDVVDALAAADTTSVDALSSTAA
jgi:hypothetical protein